MAKRIDGKCGKIKKFTNNTVHIKLKNGGEITIGVGFLATPKGFNKLSVKQMKQLLAKPHLGYKKGQNVCISKEEPLYR